MDHVSMILALWASAAFSCLFWQHVGQDVFTISAARAVGRPGERVGESHSFVLLSVRHIFPQKKKKQHLEVHG